MSHVDLIHHLKGEEKIPCIFFCFSRSLTEKKAATIKDMQFLTPAENAIVIHHVREKLNKTDPAIRELETTKKLRNALSRGIAFHHAGLLPILKELVEELFGLGLVRVLFATETFAVGINMPAKTVCFDSLEKYDGTAFRYLSPREYFQLAGRAGRRGLDQVGFVISLVNPEFVDLKRISYLLEEDKEPIKSQFRLSYNTILNLLHNHTPEERKIILQSSFYTYQRGMQGMQAIFSAFENKRKRLEELGYVRGEKLTEKGEFARHIYTQELLVGELFTTSLSDQLQIEEILLAIGFLVYEEKRHVEFRDFSPVHSISLQKKVRSYKVINRFFEQHKYHFLEQFLLHWFTQNDFCSLLDITTLSEGDIVRFFRQVIDLLHQVSHATSNADLRGKIEFIISKIDRDVVRPQL